MSSDGSKYAISIGMPIFNAEKFIVSRLNSILNQSFTDFELIISDNGSTDNTRKICEDYMLQDKRIHYFRHEENKGVIWNLSFVLEHAKADYFVWASADDEWENNFIEKNMIILNSNQNLIASMSKVDLVTDILHKGKTEQHIIKKIRKIIVRENLHSLTGQYDQKLRLYLKNSMCDMIYGVFKTKQLKESFVNENFGAIDWATNINILEKGDLYVINEVLFKKNISGISASTTNYTKMFDLNLINRIFPYLPLTKWFIRNRRFKLFIKNFDYFCWLNFVGFLSFILGLFQSLKHNKS